MLRGIFVTGTDTGVGKTVVSAALMHRFRACPSLRYWKPIETGVVTDDDTAEVIRLSGASSAQALREGVRLPEPLSPHLAASRVGMTISLPPLMECAWSQPEGDRWVVEGAGGVLVPLNDHELMIDLIAVLGLPVVIAARSGLGTINHTLLTIEALRARAIPIAGVVMVGPVNPDNRVAIETRGHVVVLGELPTLVPLTPTGLQQAADTLARGGELDPFLR